MRRCGWERLTGGQPALAAAFHAPEKPTAVLLHLRVQSSPDGWISGNAAFETMVPIIALQGPIEHHKTTGQTAIGDRLIHTEPVRAVLERSFEVGKGRWAIASSWPITTQVGD